MKSVTLQQPLENGRVRCDTCAHHCLIDRGEVGSCGVRQNQDGELFSRVYGRMAASHVDPIEKKPLFHFRPGARTYSVSTVGCNLTCRHCQNASISQMPVDEGRIAGRAVSPEEVLRLATAQQCRIIAYTYTEPAIYWDYARDIAVLAKRAGMANAFVTNGFWSRQGLDGLLDLMDAANVDLKAFSDETYRLICSASLRPVLETIGRMRESGVWVEVTTLVIPGLNDSDAELRGMAAFIASVDAEMPWHVSRFHPTYRMQERPPTPPETLIRAREIGLAEGLKYVYVGNLRDAEGLSTRCPACHTQLIDRYGFTVQVSRLADGTCPQCGHVIAGIWK